jgi:hypothetical protein
MVTVNNADARSCSLVLVFARLRSLHSGSLHITSPLFSRCTRETMTPMAHRSALRRSVAIGCSRTLLTSCRYGTMFVAVDRASAQRPVTHSWVCCVGAHDPECRCGSAALWHRPSSGKGATHRFTTTPEPPHPAQVFPIRHSARAKGNASGCRRRRGYRNLNAALWYRSWVH